VGLKHRLNYDDSLDVAGIHGVGGLVGMLLIGVLATATVTGGDDGLLYGGGLGLLGRQAAASVVVAVYAFVITWLVATVIQRTIGFRVEQSHERSGLDLIVHGETAYDLGIAPSGQLAGILGRPAAPPTGPGEATGQQTAAVPGVPPA
jgi:Amt family ammonium transporter